jgi:hypothetical protein
MRDAFFMVANVEHAENRLSLFPILTNLYILPLAFVFV